MKFLLCIIMFGLVLSCSQNDSGSKEGDSDKTKSQKTEKGVTVPVEAYIVKKGKIEEKLPFTAILQPSHAVDIVSEPSGKITKIVKEIGHKVEKNETLAIIDDVVAKSNFEQAKAQVLTAENNLKIAELNLKSDKQLFENGDISELQYENSELAVKTAEANHLAALANLKFMKKQFADTRITSPIKGVVSRKFVELGSMVNPSMPVYRVVDLNILKLTIGVPQSYISNVEVGDEAEVYITPLKNKLVTGYVKYISPQADETTGAFTTEIHLTNTNKSEIKAGMAAKVNLILKTREEQLVVPNYALITKNSDQSVYKIENKVARLNKVTLGGSYGSKSVIEEGIQSGDTIVVVGMKNLGVETGIWIETIHNQDETNIESKKKTSTSMRSVKK